MSYFLLFVHSENNKSGEKLSRRERIRNKDDDKTKDAQDSSDEDNAAEHGKYHIEIVIIISLVLLFFFMNQVIYLGCFKVYLEEDMV